MKPAAWVLAALMVASGAAASDAPPPPPDSTEAPPPAKPRLGGGFKGQTPPPAKAPATPPKKASALPASGKTAPRVVIDNALVKKGAPPASGSTAAQAPPPPPPPPVEMPRITDLQGHDESYWRARAATLRSAVTNAEQALAAAEAEEKREENDFYAWDDGQYRDNVIKPAWDKARDETVRARESLDSARKDLEALDDEVRKAGAFPGWIRE